MDAIPGGARGRSEPAIRSVRCGAIWRLVLGRLGRRSVRHCISTALTRVIHELGCLLGGQSPFAELRRSSRRACVFSSRLPGGS